MEAASPRAEISLFKLCYIDNAAHPNGYGSCIVVLYILEHLQIWGILESTNLMCLVL